MSQKNVVNATVKTECTSNRKRDTKRSISQRGCIQHRKYIGRLGAISAREKRMDAFETGLFEVAILHQGRGTSERLDLAVTKFIG